MIFLAKNTKIANGEYDAVISRVEARTRYRRQRNPWDEDPGQTIVRVTFQIGKVHLFKYYMPSISPKANLYGLLKEVGHKIEGGSANVRTALLHKKLRVHVGRPDELKAAQQ